MSHGRRGRVSCRRTGPTRQHELIPGETETVVTVQPSQWVDRHVHLDEGTRLWPPGDTNAAPRRVVPNCAVDVR